MNRSNGGASIVAIEGSAVLAKETTVSARPTLAQVEASTVLAKDATVTARPTLAQVEASTVLAKDATVTARPTLAQVEASTILAKTNNVALQGTPTDADSSPLPTGLLATSDVAPAAGGFGAPVLFFTTNTGVSTVIDFLYVEAASAGDTYEVELMQGPPGTEVGVSRIRFQTPVGGIPAPIPIKCPRIAAGINVSIRARNKTAASESVRLHIIYHEE